MKLDITDAESKQQLNRRAFLRAGLAAVSMSILAACGPAAAPAPTSLPAAPTVAAAAAKPAATTAPAAAATTAPAAAPTAAAAAAPTGTLRVANADFSSETFDPIVVGGGWPSTLYDLLLVFDEQGNVKGNIAEDYNLSSDGLT
jgi:ABC-type transport system substrate-binding protein